MVKNAFDIVCGQRLRSDYYCSMEKYFMTTIQRLDYRKMLKEAHSPVEKLYSKPYPKPDEAFAQFSEFEASCCTDGEAGYQMSEQEASAIVYWIYRVYGTPTARRFETRKIISQLEEAFDFENLAFSGNILYLSDRVELIVIDKFEDFFKEIESFDEKNNTIFYRGHGNIDYKLLPSIMRKDGWLRHEHDMYNELRINCAGDFMNCVTHLDYLVEMQHYGLPTRLLDITGNPLVALYFACESEQGSTGEIVVFNVGSGKVKYPGSDLVSVLASLSLISYDEKQNMIRMIGNTDITDEKFNEKAIHLLHEIKIEKPAFKNCIVKEDVGSAAFVLSEKKNNRIIKQDGAFIICGLFETEKNPINSFRYSEQDKIKVFAITPKGKRNIMAQLERFSVNRASLFPEIEEVAGYIKEKYEKE